MDPAKEMVGRLLSELKVVYPRQIQKGMLRFLSEKPFLSPGPPRLVWALHPLPLASSWLHNLRNESWLITTMVEFDLSIKSQFNVIDQPWLIRRLTAEISSPPSWDELSHWDELRYLAAPWLDSSSTTKIKHQHFWAISVAIRMPLESIRSWGFKAPLGWLARDQPPHSTSNRSIIMNHIYIYIIY